MIESGSETLDINTVIYQLIIKMCFLKSHLAVDCSNGSNDGANVDELYEGVVGLLDVDFEDLAELLEPLVYFGGHDFARNVAHEESPGRLRVELVQVKVPRPATAQQLYIYIKWSIE
jgi:hypothetical protein